MRLSSIFAAFIYFLHLGLWGMTFEQEDNARELLRNLAIVVKATQEADRHFSNATSIFRRPDSTVGGANFMFSLPFEKNDHPRFHLTFKVFLKKSSGIHVTKVLVKPTILDEAILEKSLFFIRRFIALSVLGVSMALGLDRISPEMVLNEKWKTIMEGGYLGRHIISGALTKKLSHTVTNLPFLRAVLRDTHQFHFLNPAQHEHLKYLKTFINSPAY